MQVTVEAPAKINLTLDVVGRRPDGYHRLLSIMQAVDCYDTLTAKRADEGIRLETAGTPPCDARQNIAYRAAELFFRHTGVAGGVSMTLHKRIPMQAGMGGGSADGAAALLALDVLYDTALSPAQMRALGARLGADVPFCLLGGTALAAGIGEELTPLKSLPACSIVIAQPRGGVSTAAAYAALDAAPIPRHPHHPVALAALEAGDLAGLCRQVYNVFEPATAVPGVADIRRKMAAYHPLASQMTGSGSAVFGLFTDAAAAQACAAQLKKAFPVAFVCRPCGGPRVKSEL